MNKKAKPKVEKEKRNLKKTVIGAFELPKEIVYNLPILSLIGNEELSLENYKGVIEYSEERLRFNTSIGVLRIEGKKLFIKQITAESVAVTGVIGKIEFLL